MIGYHNSKESRSKTVIKVVQYDKNWKRGRIASIKGDSGNVFEGITEPFYAGNVSIAEDGDDLYICTSREMFKGEDGLNHQSNISFVVDTEVMDAFEQNPVYCSHSFNQIVRANHGTVCILNHGDAYPRAVTVSILDGMDDDKHDLGSDIGEQIVCPQGGKKGDNYTGLEAIGMEMSKTHAIACVLMETEYKSHNMDFIWVMTRNLTSRDTVSKNTYYFGRKDRVSGFSISGVDFIKISNERFALLCSNMENGEKTTTFTLLNGEGKKMSQRKLPNTFDVGRSCQPVAYKGNIVFVEGGGIPKTCIIPIK